MDGSGMIDDVELQDAFKKQGYDLTLEEARFVLLLLIFYIVV